MNGKKCVGGTAEREENCCDQDANHAMDGICSITDELNAILADVYALYLKSRNFYWHMKESHLLQYGGLLDEQSRHMLAMMESLAQLVRRMAAHTLKSIGDVARRQRVLDNDSDYVEPMEMLAELAADNGTLVDDLRHVKQLCVQSEELLAARFVESWIDQSERLTWRLLRSSVEIST